MVGMSIDPELDGVPDYFTMAAAVGVVRDTDDYYSEELWRIMRNFQNGMDTLFDPQRARENARKAYREYEGQLEVNGASVADIMTRPLVERQEVGAELEQRLGKAVVAEFWYRVMADMRCGESVKEMAEATARHLGRHGIRAPGIDS